MKEEWFVTKMRGRGRITVPKAVRDLNKIQEGDLVHVDVVKLVEEVK